MNNKKFEIAVSIGDAGKAEIELRTYGLQPQVAEKVIIEETSTAVEDYGIVPQEAISPKLIELFGEQHIIDAVKYSYLFMDDYELEFEEFLDYLSIWLQNHRPEEFVTDSSEFREFLDEIFRESENDWDEDEEDLEDNIDEEIDENTDEENEEN